MPAITFRQAQATDAAMVQEMLDEAARWVDAMGVVMCCLLYTSDAADD